MRGHKEEGGRRRREGRRRGGRRGGGRREGRKERRRKGRKGRKEGNKRTCGFQLASGCILFNPDSNPPREVS